MTHSDRPRTIAYFSMEIGLEPQMPTYSGGLGVLAGDTLRAAADAGVPMVAVTLLHREGYFRQKLDEDGNQTEVAYDWEPAEYLKELDEVTEVEIEGRKVLIHAWCYNVAGVQGHTVPVYFLDTNLAPNDPYDKRLTGELYGGDERYRLCQEVLLGIGGIAMLEALGHRSIQTCHMNEGHSALLSLALLERVMGKLEPRAATEKEYEAVQSQCVFTTHTPVPAGHDRFPAELVRKVLGPVRTDILELSKCLTDGELNMTSLALHCSRYVNGVSMRHEQISEDMFPTYPFNSITNGVHAVEWTSPSFAALYDRHLPEWRRDNRYLRYAVSIHRDEVLEAHVAAKARLLAAVRERSGVELSPATFTVGFARRATPYKRADMIFSDMKKLLKIKNISGPLQIIYAGKAHPRDEKGKELIRRIFQAAEELEGEIPIVYLEGYDMELGGLITSGVDIWLNTPEKPREASGTSGMKAALNGVPSLSTLDGWWIEGHVEGVTGWSVGEEWRDNVGDVDERTSLYGKLEHVILPLFYNRPQEYARVMRHAIALNGSFFNAQRMISQYVENAYRIEKDDQGDSD
ncbi:MAG: alpha-glucan family phosphorylase [Candidatus Eisenbacteria bacterium]|nr:alpha-glucan family phosphorylase [Candidatus Eisenbacteria bacterium]